MSAALKVAIAGGPYALAAGPDKAMWVTLVHSGAIARVTETGDVTMYQVDPDSRPSIITAGPDEAMWFTRTGDDRIGRITTAGELTAFELAKGSGPFGITAGADGALWFTAMTSGAIDRISVDGELSALASVGGAPAMIVTGPDNALRFTLNGGNAVGRMTPADGVAVRELPTAAAGPVGIATTHDDAVWFTEILADKLGRIPMDDAIQEMDLPGKPHAVVADPDDGVWVSLWGSNQIARRVESSPPATTQAPDGWTQTLSAKDEIQRVIAPLTTAVSSREYQVGGTYSGSLSGPEDTGPPEGTLEVGYQIGCGIDMSTSNGVTLTGSVGMTPSVGVGGIDVIGLASSTRAPAFARRHAVCR